MENLFDLVAGLPVHPLIDHFVVVLVPLFALLQILIVFNTNLKAKFGWITVSGLAVALGATAIAKSSGESLSLRVGFPGEHAEQGEQLVAVVFALFISSAAWMVFTEKYELPVKQLIQFVPWLGKISAVIAIAAIVSTAIAGHSGAKAVWENRIASDRELSPGSATSGASDYELTAAAVSTHASANDCWSVVNGKVYDLTDFVNRHPGGSGNIKLMCGKDASSAFSSQHGASARPVNELSNYLLGPLVGSNSDTSLLQAPAGEGEDGDD